MVLLFTHPLPSLYSRLLGVPASCLSSPPLSYSLPAPWSFIPQLSLIQQLRQLPEEQQKFFLQSVSRGTA